MKHPCILLLSFILLCAHLGAQSLDIHKQSFYYPHSSQLKSRYQYYYDHWSEKQVKHGRYSEWSSKGVLLRDMHYLHDKADGTERQYTVKGKLKAEKIWQAGKLLKVEHYRKNGTLKNKPANRNNTSPKCNGAKILNAIKVPFNRLWQRLKTEKTKE